MKGFSDGGQDEAEGVAEAALKDVDHEGGEHNRPGKTSFWGFGRKHQRGWQL